MAEHPVSSAAPKLKPALTALRARELLRYEPETGILRRTDSDKIAGGLNKYLGYIYVSIDNVRYLAHRVIWLIVTGAWPEADVDHINGIRHDNRWINLRAATRAQNLQNSRRHSNSRSGFKGVVPNGSGWLAQIYVAGKNRCLGTFRTPEAAHAAYCTAAQEHFGNFANAGHITAEEALKQE
jgi:hypothetical protein